MYASCKISLSLRIRILRIVTGNTESNHTVKSIIVNVVADNTIFTTNVFNIHIERGLTSYPTLNIVEAVVIMNGSTIRTFYISIPTIRFNFLTIKIREVFCKFCKLNFITSQFIISSNTLIVTVDNNLLKSFFGIIFTTPLAKINCRKFSFSFSNHFYDTTHNNCSCIAFTVDFCRNNCTINFFSRRLNGIFVAVGKLSSLRHIFIIVSKFKLISGCLYIIILYK